MKKLIKLSDTHYIIIDDTEIIYNPNSDINGHFLCLHELQYGWKEAYIKNVKNCQGCRKITHSTQPELLGEGWMQSVLPLLLSEVEEVINGYNIEKMAYEHVTDIDHSQFDRGIVYGFHKGFKAHQKLVKDKLFTVEDIKKAIGLGYDLGISFIKTKSFSEIIESLLPKTEWDIEIDEQGKIKLI